MTLTVRVPEELSARLPAEQRGPGLDRDAVRLLVSRGTEVSHHTFEELPRLLRAGDLLVVNTSETLAAAVDGWVGHARVVVHFSTRGDDGRWAVELRDPDGLGTTRARAGGPAGTEVRLPDGARLVLEEPLRPGSGRLWWASVAGTDRARGAGSGLARGTGPDRARGTEPDRTRGTGAEAAEGTRPGRARAAGAEEPGGTGPERTRATSAEAARGTGPDGGRGTSPAGGRGTGAHGTPGTEADRARGAEADSTQGTEADGTRSAGDGGTRSAGDGGTRSAGDGGTRSAGDGGAGILRLMREHGRPIRYSYTERDQPLSVYRTVFALPSADGAGSAEMPSAARPFTVRMVTELVSRGVQFAPVMLHTGVASAEAHEPPYPERFAVPEASARLINAVKAGDGRVVAVGTTAVRAVESAVGADGVVRARAGWTDLVVTPEREVRVVDGLLTGLHEPEASHLLMLEAVAGRAAVDRSYEAALRGLYLWHEFGDVHLILPTEGPHSEHCASNCR